MVVDETLNSSKLVLTVLRFILQGEKSDDSSVKIL